jgi:hypothetical protein
MLSQLRLTLGRFMSLVRFFVMEFGGAALGLLRTTDCFQGTDFIHMALRIIRPLS